jgi:hypothetical protein
MDKTGVQRGVHMLYRKCKRITALEAGGNRPGCMHMLILDTPGQVYGRVKSLNTLL